MAAGAGMMPRKKPKNKTWVAGGDQKNEGASSDNPE